MPAEDDRQVANRQRLPVSADSLSSIGGALVGLIVPLGLVAISSLIACLCIALFAKKGRRKKLWVSIFAGLLLIFPLTYGVLLFLEFVPPASTDLSEANISGYAVNQELTPVDIDEALSPTDFEGNRTYEVKGSNLMYITLSSETNKIREVQAYFQEDIRDKDFLAPSLGRLTVGKSSFNDVVALYGDKYERTLFSDVYETVISFSDSKNKLKLTCCFNNDILVAAFLEST
jgi:hypothetical protein